MRFPRFLSVLLLASVLSAVVGQLSGCATEAKRRSETFALLGAVTFSPDGKSIAAARWGYDVVFVYDAATLKRKTVILGNGELSMAVSVSFAPDSVRLAAPGVGETFVIWNATTGEEAVRIPELKGAMAAAFSPTGDLLATAGPGSDVVLWDLAEAKRRATLKGHGAAATAVAFSGDGRLLASGGADRTVRVWSVESRQQIAELPGHAYPIHSLSFSPDAALIAVYAGDLRLWEIADRSALEPVLNKADTSALAGFAALTWIFGTAAGVHAGGGPIGAPPSPGFFDPHYQAAKDWYAATFSPDGSRLAASRFAPSFSGDQEVVIVDVKSKATVLSFPCHKCFRVSFSRDGKRLATGGVGGVKVLDADTGKAITPAN